MPISALTGDGIDALAGSGRCPPCRATAASRPIACGHEDGAAQAWLYSHGEVLERVDTEENTEITVRLAPEDVQSRFERAHQRAKNPGPDEGRSLMTTIPVPTRAGTRQPAASAVLDGTSSRLAAAEWAAEVQENIESEDPEAVDPEMWHLLRLAASLDVEVGRRLSPQRERYQANGLKGRQ